MNDFERLLAEQRKKQEQLAKAKRERERRMNYWKVGGALVAFGMVIGLILLMLCTTAIGPGYAGVVYDRTGGLKGETLKPGWHLVDITDHVTEYNISTETQKYTKEQGTNFNISTREGKLVDVDAAFSYHFDFETLPKTFQKFRGRDVQSIIDSYVHERMMASIRAVTPTYGVLDIYGEKQSEINNKVFENFRDSVKDVGIVIETFSFSRIEPDEQTRAAIQNKTDAQQILDTLKIQQEQARVTAETERIKAQGQADAAVIAAQGQAKANNALQESLTPMLLQRQWIEAWKTGGSQVPTYVTGDASNFMMQLPPTK